MLHLRLVCRWVLLWTALVLCGSAGGCGPSGPRTHPVKGKVVSAKADNLKRFAGQSIELQSTIESDTRGFGQIQPDGTFSISTYRQGKALKGAIEGQHKARIQIDMTDAEGNPRKQKWGIDPKYTRFESTPWTITVPGSEEVVLTLP